MSRRPLKIAGCSGSVSDRRPAMARLAKIKGLDFIMGDWMSEYNMSTRGAQKMDPTQAALPSWEPTFIESLVPALEDLSKNGIKVACNAGASDTELLAQEVLKQVNEKGLKLKVAWVQGDDVSNQMKRLMEGKEKGGTGKETFKSLTVPDQTLANWGYEPIYAQAYIGCWGIVEAFNNGADIVVCGRVADAGPVIAAAAYWHGWSRQDHLHELAGALLAGHVIECSNYVTGGNFSGFKQILGKWSNIGYPIAEIEHTGEFTVTMEEGLDGLVTVQTVTAQILYEIQGPLYYNSDVTADLTNITVIETGKNRVKVSGVGYGPPPPTTKVGLTANGGYQAEISYYAVGLDINEKADMLRNQLEFLMPTSKYTTFQVTQTGSSKPNPDSQNEATVEFRIFAQSRSVGLLMPDNFIRPITDIIMQTPPGVTPRLDIRMGVPKPYLEYFVTLIPQSEIQHQVHILGDGEGGNSTKTIDIPGPPITKEYGAQPLLSSGSNGEIAQHSLKEYGETKFVPLGLIVHARSGDKGSDANVGFFVRNQDEYPWLKSLLTVRKVKELLGKDYKEGDGIERFELPNLLAVHFLLKNHLDRGVASTSTYDYLGKNVGEYLRSKWVDVPIKFLNRGNI